MGIFFIRNWGIIFVCLFWSWISFAQFGANPSCIDFKINEFSVKDDCQPARVSQSSERIFALNRVLEQSQDSPPGPSSAERRIRRNFCFARFSMGSTQQFSVTAHSQHPFLPHREYCTKDGLIFECGQFTTSAAVNCWPHDGRGHQDIKPGCHMTVVVNRPNFPDRPIRCRCSRLGCGQAILRAFPREVSESRIKEALNSFGCGQTQIIGYEESQAPAQPGEIREFVISSERCQVVETTSECNPGSSAKFIFGSERYLFRSEENPRGFGHHIFPLVCVPDTNTSDGVSRPNEDET